MKSTYLTLALLACVSLSAQNKKIDILKTANIFEIENFLKTAHPDDPRRIVLKSKVIQLKNNAWMKQRPTVDNQNKIKQVQLQMVVNTSTANLEALEFQRLIKADSDKEKTVQLLNQLFDNDESNNQAILLVQNNSDCNMVLKVEGKDFYNLAIPSRGENSLVLKKGQYSLKANVCDIPYQSGKSIANNTMVTLTKTAVIPR